jgi:hypothetical protein
VLSKAGGGVVMAKASGDVVMAKAGGWLCRGEACGSVRAMAEVVLRLRLDVCLYFFPNRCGRWLSVLVF